MALSLLHDSSLGCLACAADRAGGVRIVFLGGARYGRPLDATNRKKFHALQSLGELFVIGYSHDLRPRCFSDHARFYLLPQLPLAFLRYLEMLVCAPLLVCWLIFRHRVQIVVAQSPYEGVAAAAAKKIAKSFGYPLALVVESHGDFEERLLLQRCRAAPAVYRRLMRRAARFSLQHADLLRAVSAATQRQLEKWSPAKSIVRFPAWTDMEAFLSAGAEEKKYFSQEILYAGVLTPLKGVHHLIEAFAAIAAEFPDARLTLVGRAQDEIYTADLKRQVVGAGLTDRVGFAAPLPQANLALRMKNAAVLALPSLSEGLGRVIIEAMAAATPVIASDVGGIPEIVKDGDNGFLVAPGDERGLAEKLRWMLKNPHEARRLGRCARVFAQQFFSTEAYLEGYRRVFRGAQDSIGCGHAPSSV
jgi:glycosyltransferase involved in cell wall biosynthesis